MSLKGGENSVAIDLIVRVVDKRLKEVRSTPLVLFFPLCILSLSIINFML